MAEEASKPAIPEEHLRVSMECPICYFSYDNIFRTPLLLPCSHTFCMECLSRLCLFIKHTQDFPCPLCRTLAQVPPGGVPKMQPNPDIVVQFPPEMQQLQDVWLDGRKLCWVRKGDSDQDKGSLVAIQLLSNPGEHPTGTDGLINIQQPSFLHWCRALCSSIWGLLLTILAIGLLLFAVVFLPVYLNRSKLGPD
ncbi:RING finger protein 223-like [Discoglossus pictus]